MGVLLDFEGGKAHHVCSFMWADIFWIMSHFRRDLEQMLRYLIGEAEKWDPVTKPASLWWTSTYETEEKCDLSTSGCRRFSF